MALLSISSNLTLVKPTLNYTIRTDLVGAAANAAVTITLFAQSPMAFGGLATVVGTQNVVANQSGGATYTFSFLDTEGTPRGVYEYWARVDSETVSSKIVISFADVSGAVPTLAPTPSPSPSGSPAPTPAPVAASVLYRRPLARVRVTDPDNITVTGMGFPANGAVDIKLFTQSQAINGNTPMVALSTTVAANESGFIGYVLNSTDSGVAPRGTYSSWAVVTSGGKDLVSNSVQNILLSDTWPADTGTMAFTPEVTLTTDKSSTSIYSTLVFTVAVKKAKPSSTYQIRILSGAETSPRGAAVEYATLTTAADGSGQVLIPMTKQYATLLSLAGRRSFKASALLDSTTELSQAISSSVNIVFTDPNPSTPAPSPGPTPSPSPAPTPAPGFSDGMQLVAVGQVSTDLLQSIKNQTSTGQSLAAALARPQQCDYDSMLVSSIQSSEEDSLGMFIRENIRNNAGDNTKLKAYARNYFNAATVAKGGSTRAYAQPSQTSQQIMLGAFTDMVPYASTTLPAFTIEGGVIRFTRKARFLLNFDINVCIWSGQGTLAAQTTAPLWRYGNTQNHEVTWTVQMVLKGSLAAGASEYIIPLTNSYILQSAITDKYAQRVGGTYLFDSFNGAGVLGNIQSMEIRLVRGGWVATYDGVQDKLGFFKTTDAGTADNSNYLELIEL